MKAISDYTIYCTPEQTKKALEIGSPIQYANIADIQAKRFVNSDKGCYALPTAEQMIGWLEEHGRIEVNVEHFDGDKNWTFAIFTLYCQHITSDKDFNSRKEATLAAIDAALEYLKNNK